MKSALLVALVLAMGLAACDDDSADDTSSKTDETTVTQAAETSVARQAEPGPAPEDDPEAIPPVVQGRWGMVAADCTSTRGDAKGLLVITADQLAFYESRAALQEVIERSETRVVGTFAFTGEGQTWERRVSLDTQDDGTVLIRREHGEGAEAGPFRYERCTN